MSRMAGRRKLGREIKLGRKKEAMSKVKGLKKRATNEEV